MVVQYLLIFARRYWPQLMLPITIPVGCLGLWLESKFRSHDAVEPAPSIVSQREERRLAELEGRGGGEGERERTLRDSPDKGANRTTSEMREERRLRNITSSSSSSPDPQSHLP